MMDGPLKEWWNGLGKLGGDRYQAMLDIIGTLNSNRPVAMYDEDLAKIDVLLDKYNELNAQWHSWQKSAKPKALCSNCCDGGCYFCDG